MNLIFNPETTSNYLVGGLCKTLARVCRLAWKDIEAITNVVNSIEDIINQQILQAEKGFKFFEEIISEMVENVPHLTVSLSKRTAIVFRDTGLGEILNFTVFTLLNLKNIPAGLNKQLLHIINLCFSFDFLAGISDKTIEDPNSLQVPLSWKTHFSSPELLQKVELLILSNCLNEIEYASIRVLNQMGAVRKTIFQELDEKHQFIYRYSSVLLNIFKEKILSEDSLFEFLQTIKRFFSNFLVKEIALAIDFNVFLEHLARFSFKLFTDANCLFSNDYNSIPIWAFLSFEARSHCDFISNYIPLIFDAFTENSLNFVTEENFLSENFAKNKTQLEKLGIFSVYFYDKVYVLLQKRIQAENEFIQSRITREYQVSWLVMIASSFISTDDKKSGEEINDLLVHTLLQLINSVDHSPFCIQLSILTFFQSFTKTYLCSSMDNQWGDSDSMIGNISVGQVTDLLIEFLLKNLSQYKQGTILEETMSLFEKVCIGYYSSKILLSLPQARALLRYPNCLFTNRKLRRRFFTVLTQLWAAEESASAEFYEKLVVKIRNSRRTFEEIQVLFIEIQGIFKAIGKSEGYMELFELIQEDIWAITQNYYIGMISDPETLKCMLLMFKEITENRNERIDFNLSDAHGIIMFKNISEILVHYAPIDTGESVMKKASLFLGIVNNMISGEYISFGVFEIYQDEILNKILLVCFDLISGLTTDFTVIPT